MWSGVCPSRQKHRLCSSTETGTRRVRSPCSPSPRATSRRASGRAAAVPAPISAEPSISIAQIRGPIFRLLRDRRRLLDRPPLLLVRPLALPPPRRPVAPPPRAPRVSLMHILCRASRVFLPRRSSRIPSASDDASDDDLLRGEIALARHVRRLCRLRARLCQRRAPPPPAARNCQAVEVSRPQAEQRASESSLRERRELTAGPRLVAASPHPPPAASAGRGSSGPAPLSVPPTPLCRRPPPPQTSRAPRSHSAATVQQQTIVRGAYAKGAGAGGHQGVLLCQP